MGLLNYELGEELSRVGPSTFFRAKNAILGNDVLLRRLDIDPARPENVRETFFREQRLMASLNHPYIQRPLDVFEEDGYLWSVHDLREVRNSWALVEERGPLPVSEVARMGAQAADALAHMHAQGYVHGKVQPRTIMFDDRDEAILVNFVKAGDLHAGVWPLRDVVLGLGPFSAPEEFDGAKATPASDLYGLAATIFYWLTGQYPRGGDDESAALEAAMERREPLALATVRPDVPTTMRKRIEAALAADPCERKGSVSALGSILAEVHQRRAAEVPVGFEVGARLEPHGPLGEVQVRSRIGSGAYGVVLKVRPPDGDVDYALKALKPEHRDDENAYQRFLRESRAMQPVRHENVVRVRGVGELNGAPYCVMDYIEGPDLATVILREGSLDPRQAARVAAAIARGLSAIHAEGLVHRDLKPHNILMAGDEHPIIADFGMASGGSQATRLTLTGQMVGTPAYMAPEQFVGEPATPSVDLWALGVILHEMLTGALPYARETTIETIRAIREAPHPTLPSDVPGDLAEVVLRLQEKDPERRFESAAAVSEALEQRSLV